jgi:prefoldin subunit 5
MEEKIQQRKRTRYDMEEANKSLNSKINQYTSLENPTIKDLMNMIAEDLKTHLTIQEKLMDLEDDVTKLETFVNKVNSKVDSMTSHCERIEISMHKLEQKEIDNDVFVGGFTQQPNENVVIENLTKIYKFDKNSIEKKFSFKQKLTRKTTSTPNKSSHHEIFNMIIKFKSLDDKTNFLRKKKEMGPVMMEQLGISQMNQKSKAIRIVNRLTSFNLMAQRILNTAKLNNKWEAVKYHNGIFKVQERKDSKWKIFGTMKSLEEIIKNNKEFAAKEMETNNN